MKRIYLALCVVNQFEKALFKSLTIANMKQEQHLVVWWNAIFGHDFCNVDMKLQDHHAGWSSVRWLLHEFIYWWVSRSDITLLAFHKPECYGALDVELNLSPIVLPKVFLVLFGSDKCCVISGYVHQYNSVNSRPDVLKSLYSPLQPSSSMEGLR